MSDLINTIQITQNDFGYQIPFTLEDGNGNPYNLAGATLSLKVQNVEDTSINLALNGTMALDVPLGACHYTVASGDFPIAGDFIYQIIAVYGSLTISWPVGNLKINPALPQSQPWTE